MKKDMSNEEYVKSLGMRDEQAQRTILKALDQYGDNKWWLSDDPKVIGYHQLKATFDLVPFDKFKKGAEALLERPMQPQELLLPCMNKQLQQEVEKAWEKLEHHKTEKNITRPNFERTNDRQTGKGYES